MAIDEGVENVKGTGAGLVIGGGDLALVVVSVLVGSVFSASVDVVEVLRDVLDVSVFKPLTVGGNGFGIGFSTGFVRPSLIS